MMFFVKLFFAGVWAQVWHWGLGIGVIICLLAAAWFSPVGKKTLTVAAIVVFAFMVGMGVGTVDEKRRHTAQEQVLDKHVKDVVKDTNTPAAKQRPDPWDSPEN